MTRPKFKIMIASSETITVNRFLKDYIFELSKYFCNCGMQKCKKRSTKNFAKKCKIN